MEVGDRVLANGEPGTIERVLQTRVWVRMDHNGRVYLLGKIAITKLEGEEVDG